MDKAALEHHLWREPECAFAQLSACEQWVLRHEQAIVRLADSAAASGVATEVVRKVPRADAG